MYVIIGMQNCVRCDELKTLLDEKGIQYNYLDMTEMPNNPSHQIHIYIYNNHLHLTEMPDKTMTYLRIHCNSFPLVLHINHPLSNVEETLTHFNQPYLAEHILKSKWPSICTVDRYYIKASEYFCCSVSRGVPLAIGQLYRENFYIEHTLYHRAATGGRKFLYNTLCTHSVHILRGQNENREQIANLQHCHGRWTPVY
jgi:hypothetical protein